VDTEASTEFAAVAVIPALVRPPTKARREMPCDRYFATSSLIVRPQKAEVSLRRRGGFRARPELGAEIVRHHLDLVRGPQSAASDHAVDRGLPGAAVLAAVAEHRIGMALEASGLDHVAPGMRCGLLRLR